MSELSMDIEDPPLLDLIDINWSHYMSSADLEHGRHYTALPTPWVSGVSGKAELRIGSRTAWTLEQPSARAGILEFTGQGLGALEKALESKEKLMAVLGARMLEHASSVQETAEAVRTRHRGDESTLQALAQTVSLGMTKMVRMHAKWIGLNDTMADQINAELNHDFYDTRLTPQEIQVMLQLLQAEKISYETFYWNLAQGEVTRPGITSAEELKQIDTEVDITQPIELPEEKDTEEPETNDTEE